MAKNKKTRAAAKKAPVKSIPVQSMGTSKGECSMGACSTKGGCCSGICCPITGVNIVRFLLTVIVASVFYIGFETYVHTTLLADIYAQTPQLWRTPAEMPDYLNLMLVAQVLVVAVITFIFTRNYEGRGIGEGLRFGSMIGVLLGVVYAASYTWMPISQDLALAWAASGFVSSLGIGVICSLLYRR